MRSVVVMQSGIVVGNLEKLLDKRGALYEDCRASVMFKTEWLHKSKDSGSLFVAVWSYDGCGLNVAI